MSSASSSKSKMSQFSAMWAGFVVFAKTIEAITRAFFDFSCTQGEAYERITCSVAYRDVSAEMQERVMGSQGNDPEIPALAAEGESGLFMTFVTESTLALYRRWVQGGKPVSPGRLADIAVALVCGGTDRLLGENRQ